MKTLAVLYTAPLQSGRMLTDHGGRLYTWPRNVTRTSFLSSIFARKAAHLPPPKVLEEFGAEISPYTCACNVEAEFKIL